MPTLHVALLRGINVGGTHKIKMAELRETLTAAGCGDVRTYIQSGNVVFDPAGLGDAPLGPQLAELIERRFGFPVAVTVRRGDELAEVLTRNPYGGEDTGRLHVGFLPEVPAPAAVADLDPERSPPDRFVVDGREVFMHCPNGLGRSKLTTAWFERKLGSFLTIRNWRTVGTLAEMAGV